MISHEPLADALRHAAAELQAQPLPELLPALQQRLQAVATPAPRRRLRWALAPALGACLVVLLVGALLMLLPGREPVPVAQAQPSNFITVIGPERWQQLAQQGDTRAWLVSAELPRERLAALGLPYDPARAGERVRAQLLMQASGDVIAVRVLN
jgi:hypothetical protein